MGAGKSIHRIDEGFYICGVDALHDDKYLHQLGIKCILNAAQDRLYSLQPHHGRQEGIELAKLPELFEVKIVGADDCEDCNLSMHFQDIADFIEAGRAKGGVVVHCAAGVSRASTSCMAYLMMKEHWKLEAAHRKIHAVRNIVCPNSGFWRQLRDLEASLEAQGIVLRPLPEDWVPPPQPTRKGEEEKFGATADETRASLWGLDRDVKSVDSFLTQHLTAKVTPKAGIKTDVVAKDLEKLNAACMKIESCTQEREVLMLRAALVPSMTSAGLCALLGKVPSVAHVECE